jgi:hypothetical protein
LGSAGSLGLALPAIAGGFGPGSPHNGASAFLQDDGPAEVARRLRKRRISDDMIAAAVQALAMVGVGTYEAPTATEPIVPVAGTPSPLRFLDWQVVQMTHELATRNGLFGSEIDELVPAQENAPTPSLILAAYARDAQTTGGDLVRGLLRTRNFKRYHEIQFPGLVQAIFVGELTQVAAAANESVSVNRRALFFTAAGHRHSGPTVHHADGVCSAISGWVDSILNAVADALKVDTSEGGVLGFLGDIWNGVVDLGKALIKGLTETLTAPIVDLIKSIATVIAVISQVISLIKPWNVEIESDPAESRFGVGAETVTGTIAARVDTGFDGDWPSTVKDCAAEAGIALPSLTGANSPVEWGTEETPIDLIGVDDQENVLDSDGRARIAYTTNQEDEETAKGEEHQGTVNVQVLIKREDLKLLKETLSGALFSFLPSFVAKVLQPILGPTINTLLDKIVALEPAKTTGSLTVTYHEKKEPTPTNTPDEDDQAGCPYGTWAVSNLAAVAQSIVENLGAPGMPEIVYTDDSGSSTAEFRGDNTFTWVWDSYQISGTSAIPDTGTILVVMVLDGQISGTFDVSEGILTVGGTVDSLTITGASYLNGTYIGPIDVPTSAYLDPSAGMALSCGPGSDHMVLTPTWINVDEGYELTRIES